MLTFVECQIDIDGDIVAKLQHEISVLKAC